MESRSNPLATTSLVLSLLLVVSWFTGMCISFVPFIGFLGVLLMPIEWLLALAGLITGIMGYRASGALDGVGASAGIVGALISGLWLLFQILIFGAVFLLMGATVALSVLAALLGQ